MPVPRLRSAVRFLVLLAIGGCAFPHDHAHAAKPLGAVHFATSCSPKVAADFDTGMAWLHSFGYEDAGKVFAKVTEKDPTCAMAWWGIAMSHYHELWDNSDFSRGAAAAQKAKELAAAGKVTAREAAFIAAIQEIYSEFGTRDTPSRAAAYSQAMLQAHQASPKDSETTIFYALSLAATAAKTDRSFANQRKCGELLEPLFAAQPGHPGLAHYLIHCYDNVALAERALPAARRYAAIAPASAHAHHMPSHIFTRVGAWDDSIVSNRRSADLARAAEPAATTVEPFDQHLHALDYLEYAFLQRGSVADAQHVIEEMEQVRASSALTLTGSYALAAIPARHAVELGHWDEAAKLKVEISGGEETQAITWFARGLGSARGNDLAQARESLTRLAALRDRLKQKKDPYWASQVEVQRMALAAEIAAAEGKPEEAIAGLRAAADLEDSMDKHAVTPGPLVPARELLAAALLRAGHPAQAFAEYAAVLKVAPNRFNALAGAARAAALSGPEYEARAREYRVQLLKVNAGRAEREEIKQ